MVSQGSTKDQALKGGASINSRPLQATWPHKMEAEAAILWSCLAKFSTQSFECASKENLRIRFQGNLRMHPKRSVLMGIDR